MDPIHFSRMTDVTFLDSIRSLDMWSLLPPVHDVHARSGQLHLHAL